MFILPTLASTYLHGVPRAVLTSICSYFVGVYVSTTNFKYILKGIYHDGDGHTTVYVYNSPKIFYLKCSLHC